MTDSLGSVPRAENESAGLIHGEPCLHFRPSILAYPSGIVLRTKKDSVVPQKVSLCDIPHERVLMELQFSFDNMIFS